MDAVTAEKKQDFQQGLPQGRWPAITVALALAGIALMAICGPLAAHYSRKAAAAWFNDSARRKAAYSDAVKAEESSTGKKLLQFTPEELTAVGKVVNDRIWSASYDPKPSTADQGTANTLGLLGVSGFFLFVGGGIATIALRRGR